MPNGIPNGNQFSPSQVELPELLRLTAQYESDRASLSRAIRAKYFEAHGAKDADKTILANNTIGSMSAYGLVGLEGESVRLTEVGHHLLELVDDERALYAEFARHILLNLNGFNFVRCIQDMQQMGASITLPTLRAELCRRGLPFPRGGVHASSMRLWLEKAGVFTTGYRVNDAVLEHLLGVELGEIETLSALSEQQGSYLKALAAHGGHAVPSNELERLASAAYGTVFNEKSLPKDVLYPLEAAGFIALERGTKEYGRGAKPFLVTSTEKFDEAVSAPLLDQLSAVVDVHLLPYLRKPVSEILVNMASDDKHIKGLALEALAVRLLTVLGLQVVEVRRRGLDTGGAEVDVIAEAEDTSFRRIQTQCKNTGLVTVDVVAKEVGVSVATKANVILIVTTGRITDAARDFADKIMREQPLAIALIDGVDLAAFSADPSNIVDLMRREAHKAAKLKRESGGQNGGAPTTE